MWIKYILYGTIKNPGDIMTNIRQYMEALELGQPVHYKNLTLAPLRGPDSGLDYLVFDEALKQGLNIQELGAASVPDLHFTNGTDKPVLILQGEYVVGGKQNRMITHNIYMAAGFDGKVPVKCVQAGRWDAVKGFSTSGRRAPSSVRYAARGSQGEVWSRVSAMSADFGVASHTSNLDEVVSGRQSDLQQYQQAFSYTSGSVGVVVGIQTTKGLMLSMDFFDQATTMKKHFPKILESYAADALASGGDFQCSQPQLHQFLQSIENSTETATPIISLGYPVDLSGNGTHGSAIFHNAIALYATAHSVGSDDNFAPVHTPTLMHTSSGFRHMRER